MSEEVNKATEDTEAKQEIFEALGVPNEETKETEKETASQEVSEEPKSAVADTTEDVKEVKHEAVQEEELDFSEIEQEALKLGWKPEGVPGKKKKSAEEWMDDYSLYKKINDLGKQVQEKNSILENVAKHLESVQEASYKQAKREFDQQVAELRQLAADTIEEGEMPSEDVIAAYENDYQELKKAHEAEMSKLKTEEAKPEAAAPQSPEDVLATLSEPEKAFVKKHEKLLFSQKADDIAVQAFVVNRNNELTNEGLSPEDRITALENDLTSMFPSKFGVTKKVKPKVQSKVESASVTDKPTKGFSLNQLKPDQRELYEFFVEQGVDKDELLSQFQLIIEEEK